MHAVSQGRARRFLDLGYIKGKQGVKSSRLEYKGRTISMSVPDAPHRSEDDRCDECRAKNVPVCSHRHSKPPPPTSAQHSAMPTHSHCGPARMAEHEHTHDATQAQGPQPGMPEEGHTGHGAFEIMIEGRPFAAHLLHDGQFHSHELPFMLFPTAEALAKALVNKLEWSEPHGRPQEPEKTERS